ncbi:MAG: hypothetical protein ACREEE_13590 [Dongiaceae bacterium]
MKAENSRGMLALVILMGVVIVIGSVVVVVTIASRLINPAKSGDGDAPIAAPFDPVDVPIAEGCQVVETVIQGDRLVLRLGTGGRCNQLLLIDLRNGKLTGRVNLVATP